MYIHIFIQVYIYIYSTYACIYTCTYINMCIPGTLIGGAISFGRQHKTQSRLNATHIRTHFGVALVSHAAFVGVCTGTSDFDARTITNNAHVLCAGLACTSAFRRSKRHHVAVGIAQGGGGKGRGEGRDRMETVE